MAARFIDGVGPSDVLCVLDGDQRAAAGAHLTRFLGLVPQKRRLDAEGWFASRLRFLPSDMPPERFVLSQVRDKYLSEFSIQFGIDVATSQQAIDRALLMGGHGELYWLSQDVHKGQDEVWRDLCRVLRSRESGALSEVVDALRALFD